MSASGAVARVVFPPCPTHFLIAHKTAVLSHSSRTLSLRAADCNTNTIPPNSSLFKPSSSLLPRAHLSASSPWNLQHPGPIVPSFHDPSCQKILLETHVLPAAQLQCPSRSPTPDHPYAQNICLSVAGWPSPPFLPSDASARGKVNIGCFIL